ncbi:putative ribosomally synthesized peptide with nif11-like leader [Breznakibacter xylanolyticus]|uniref:Putative ribosomally synthesized peptide with nif11-like leader n=1 Tax=Breznakibacter xylanolyticus TaxID=990 RepID=A0A2W7MUM3_9BACT|nr:Nif11-like leader peptide family natural product precursor [Breznakibacter xylanolyticus]MBN2742480.1 Nif11-like leader peptide family natural product precursor [Marinilabiliaceae bacterium]PZX11271.1 putative ribosomally synthesized peptide with nif11-like leader [Breznakibacter xylanolyticus]
MSKQHVEDLLTKGGSDKMFRIKYDNIFTMEEFVELAKVDGFDFTVDELKQVLRENCDSFDSYGNPPKKSIWLK